MKRSQFLSVFKDPHEQVNWLKLLEPSFLYTLPSNLDILLDFFEAADQRLKSLKRVLCGGEVVDDVVRLRTRRILGVDISDNYGSTEAFLAWQCSHGSYHVNSEHILLEVVDENGQEVAAGQTGRVLVTTLHNRRMPLIRYEIGDYAVKKEDPCGCGRRLPCLSKIAGKAVDLFRVENEKFVSPWELVVRLKFHGKLKQFQIVQEDWDRYCLLFVAAEDLIESEKEELCRHFWAVLGSRATVNFRRVPVIERSPGGKFMTAKSELSRRIEGTSEGI